MSRLLSLAIAPVIIFAFYLYIRDKYEKEPFQMLLLGLLYGMVMSVPITKTELIASIFTPNGGILLEGAYHSFVVAALVEEFYKYVVLYFLVWRNPNFNERFDGIIYAVFVSLGFAFVENILYVIHPELGGLKTAMYRGIFSVPGHGLFGVTMGYYFALAKYEPRKRLHFLVSAFVVPVLLHGTYNFILVMNMPYVMVVFIPFVFYLWYNAHQKMKQHIKTSPFRGTN